MVTDPDATLREPHALTTATRAVTDAYHATATRYYLAGIRPNWDLTAGRPGRATMQTLEPIRRELCLDTVQF